MSKYLLILALCVLGAALTRAGFGDEATTTKFIEAAEVCRIEANATPKDIEDFVKKQPAANTPAKCLRACLLHKFDIMDDNGKFVKSPLLQHAHTYTEGDAKKMQTAEALINACTDIPFADDKCEAAEQFEACILEQAKAHGIEDMEM